ncbi:unnamed protein product [Fraxinus pennsylvanica]|uniref:Disease resistance N-terminal domain-containing protein n=1 Tax=Fraxinus pennsylvanica TaxID=56036 RepID=A0AAD1YSQ7_9LAMI|nr:unnamed protein product [Fraxinus pennsylvanica]
MADAIVEFLLVNLKELLLYHVDLISGVKDQVESLHKELSLMKAFLKDSREKRNESEFACHLSARYRYIAARRNIRASASITGSTPEDGSVPVKDCEVFLQNLLESPPFN